MSSRLLYFYPNPEESNKGGRGMRVLVMNDHPFIRRGMIGILESDPICDWIVEATSFSIGLDVLRKEPIDTVIVDVTLGEDSGLNFISEAQKITNDCKFVIFTSSNDLQDFMTAKELGVDGYILKNVLPEEFVQALKLIHKGRRYFDPDVLDLTDNDIEFGDGGVHQLTPKEKEVLIQLGKGKSNREIALALYISEFTVKKHVGQILSKLELSDRTQAALYANAAGIVSYVVH